MQIAAGRPKDLEKRKQILEAAKTLFLQHGYHGSSMNQIAKTAGVTKLTVYNHFKDKENLFTCAIAETCEQSMNTRPVTLSTDSDFQQAFFSACKFTLDIIYLPEALKLEHVLIELAAQHNPLLRQFYNASHQQVQLFWQDFFQQAHYFSFIKTAAVGVQTELILSLLLGTRHHDVLLGIQAIPNQPERNQVIQDSIDLFLLKYSCSR